MTRFILLITVLITTTIACSDSKPSSDQTTEQESIEVDEGEKDQEKKVIVFFGNSLTAGYGLEDGEDFPSLIQARLDSLDMPFEVVNAGLSGETTAGGVNRIDWILNQKMDVFVLELGANDMLRGFDLRSTRENLQIIIDKVKAGKPNVKVIIAGMQAPPNLGEKYTYEFASIYEDIAKKNDAALIPFLLKGVAGEGQLNLDDGIHPNSKGQYVVRDNVWQVLSTIL